MSKAERALEYWQNYTMDAFMTETLPNVHYNCSCPNEDNTLSGVGADTGYCTCDHKVSLSANTEYCTCDHTVPSTLASNTEYCNCDHSSKVSSVNDQMENMSLRGETKTAPMSKASVTRKRFEMAHDKIKENNEPDSVKYIPPSGLSMFHMPVQN